MGIAQWLERRTHYRQVSGSSPGRSGGRIFFPRVNFLCCVLFRYPSVCCRRLNRRGSGTVQWLERRTRDRQVSGSSPGRSGGRIFFPRVNFLCCVLFRYPSVCCRRLNRRGSGIAQWLERRTRDRQVSGSSPGRSGWRIFYPRVNFLCCVLFRYRFHPRVTRVASCCESAGLRTHRTER